MVILSYDQLVLRVHNVIKVSFANQFQVTKGRFKTTFYGSSQVQAAFVYLNYLNLYIVQGTNDIRPY